MLLCQTLIKVQDWEACVALLSLLRLTWSRQNYRAACSSLLLLRRRGLGIYSFYHFVETGHILRCASNHSISIYIDRLQRYIQKRRRTCAVQRTWTDTRWGHPGPQYQFLHIRKWETSHCKPVQWRARECCSPSSSGSIRRHRDLDMYKSNMGSQNANATICILFPAI